MKTIYGIDEQGFMTYETMEIGYEDDVPEGYVDTPLPTNKKGNQLPFWKPKWTGTEWVEGKTTEEFEEEAMLELLNPTPQEVSEAEFEIKILNTLMEVELI